METKKITIETIQDTFCETFGLETWGQGANLSGDGSMEISISGRDNGGKVKRMGIRIRLHSSETTRADLMQDKGNLDISGWDAFSDALIPEGESVVLSLEGQIRELIQAELVFQMEDILHKVNNQDLKDGEVAKQLSHISAWFARLEAAR